MKQSDAEEVLACLPGGRTLFTYAKDWYAVELLRRALRGSHFAAVRGSQLGNLLEKPSVRSWLGSLGRREIRDHDLGLLDPGRTETYRLGLDLFDGWAQTTRKGRDGWNLVLQLNLNTSDARLLEKRIPIRDEDPFERRYHPVSSGRHRTLAWARIDVDWESGEALIEEVQNDRIRDVRECVDRIRRENLREIQCGDTRLDAAFVLDYWDRRLRFSRACWDEAMLCAAIVFLTDELGIRRIFYHSPVSASRLKGDGAGAAPVSVYTSLPRKFCFSRVDGAPSFVRLRRKHRAGLWMHRLDL